MFSQMSVILSIFFGGWWSRLSLVPGPVFIGRGGYLWSHSPEWRPLRQSVCILLEFCIVNITFICALLLDLAQVK